MQPLSKESAEKTIVGPQKALQEFLGRAWRNQLTFGFEQGRRAGSPSRPRQHQVACQWSVSGIDHRDLVAEREGKLSEWSKEPHSKCGVRITSYRGFESLTFRKQNMRPVCPSLLEQAGLLFWLQGCHRQTLGITQKSLTFRKRKARETERTHKKNESLWALIFICTSSLTSRSKAHNRLTK